MWVALFAEKFLTPLAEWPMQGLMRAGAARRGSGSTDSQSTLNLRYILENSGAIGLVVERPRLIRDLDLGSRTNGQRCARTGDEDSPAVRGADLCPRPSPQTALWRHVLPSTASSWDGGLPICRQRGAASAPACLTRAVAPAPWPPCC